MKVTDLLIGKPLATSDAQHEHIGVAAGIPIFGLDGLTSAAYGPEQAMTLLVPLGILGVQQHLMPIFTAILILLTILYFSYRQTIVAYPNGGGSFTVASENLGDNAGLLAAAALMIDYILTAAVGISAGVTALVSALDGSKWGPAAHAHQVAMCLLVLVVIVTINLRGMKESGFAFMLPTLLFVGTLVATVAVGVYKAFITHGHPVAISPPPPPMMSQATHVVMWWLLLRAFASGCAAMTGVEAVSNGTTAFKEPRSRNANKALTVIIAILVLLLAGLSYVAKVYGITAMDGNDPNYQSVLSIQVAAVFGRGWFYFFTMGSVLAALSFSANTAFADFPRMARAIALKDFLPHVFILRGRRLLFSHGIYALTGFTALLLIIFKGDTNKLVPLYAIGAFLAFTLSQAGMVRHWVKAKEEPHRHVKLFFNGLGAFATGITLVVVLVAKFREGAWITTLLIPFLIAVMYSIKRHYSRVRLETADPTPLRLTGLEAPMVVIPVARWDKISEKAVRFGLLMSNEIKVVNVQSDEDESIHEQFETMVMAPIREHGMTAPELVVVQSSFRTVLSPLMDYILKLEDENPGRKVAVLLPELVVQHWWENLLHNQRIQILKLLLLVRGNQRIVVVNIPWYL